jgi:group I intron endonuclease
MKTQLDRGKSIIYSSILNNGLYNFKLEILKYCSPSCVIFWEQYYIDLIKPEYNILPTAGSRFGFKHSEKSIQQMSETKQGENHPLFGQNHSKETKTKMSKAHKGKSHLEETKYKISGSLLGNKNSVYHPYCQKIKVFDMKLNTKTTYSSIREAAKAFNIRQSIISKYFIRNQIKPYLGRYIFEKVN